MNQIHSRTTTGLWMPPPTISWTAYSTGASCRAMLFRQTSHLSMSSALIQRGIARRWSSLPAKGLTSRSRNTRPTSKYGSRASNTRLRQSTHLSRMIAETLGAGGAFTTNAAAAAMPRQSGNMMPRSVARHLPARRAKRPTASGLQNLGSVRLALLTSGVCRHPRCPTNRTRPLTRRAPNSS